MTRRETQKNKTEQRRSFLLVYTIAFVLTCALVFRFFPAAGKRMVWKGDGLSQHYVALCYYARWGRAVLRSILQGKPSFPTFNLHMGYGADLFTTLQYYVIGDPFSLPAVFVPQKHMLFFHDAMILLRLYFAGICFDGYCREMGHRAPAPNLCGTLIYVFCSFALFGMRHPYFLNAMIWFPLLLIGAEHIFKGRKGGLFTAAVFLSCISNFYFFYMLVIMTILYVVWRALRICLFPAFSADTGAAMKQILSFALQFLGRAVLGTALGAVFMLPILLRFVQDPRATEGVAYGLLYAADFYRQIPESFVGFGTTLVLDNWTCLGLGGMGLLGVLLLFVGTGRDSRKGIDNRKDKAGRRKKTGRPGEGRFSGHMDLKIAFIGMAFMTLVPAAGAALNGFTYPANRWIWAFCMLTAYIAVVMLPCLHRITAGRMALVLLFMSVYAVVCALMGADRSVIGEIILAAAAAAFVWLAGEFRGRHPEISGGPVSLLCTVVLTLTVILTASGHGTACFEKGACSSEVQQYHSRQYIEAMMASEAAGMKSLLGNDTFYRYSGRDLANNFALLNDVSDTQYYWSLSDSGTEQFFTETGQYNGMVHMFDNLDNRTMLDEIAGVTYYKRGDGSLLPFGYEKMEGLHYDNRELFGEAEESLPVFAFSVYKNTCALPLGFTSDRYLTRKTYDALTIPQRQEALMQGILLEDGDLQTVTSQKTSSDSGISEAEISFTEEEIPFAVRTEEGLDITGKEDGSFVVTVSDTEAALHLGAEEEGALSQGEISLLLTGMEYAAPEKGSEQKGSEQKGGEQAKEPVYGISEPVTVRVTADRSDHVVSDKKVEYTLPDNPWKTGRSDFMCCCGYTDEPLTELRMKFSRRGVYTFRGLTIIRQPMEKYPEMAQKLGQYVLENLDLHELAGSGATNRISGRLTVPDSRLLCIQIPCCRGMQAYVDGKKTPLLQADTMFCAVKVEEGTHEIELRYRTPGMAAGACISIAALLIIIAQEAAGRLRKKELRKKKRL